MMQTPPADCSTRGSYTDRHAARGLQSSRWASSTAPTPSYRPRAQNPPAPPHHPPRHAPPPAPPAAPPRRHPPPAPRPRFEKIAKRLSWKLFHLSAGFHRATSAAPSLPPGSEGASEREHFEIMFKLDFYEFYMLLERALVHLLGVFDISVSRDADPAGGFKGRARASDHAYHHNVLAALDSPDNVLHGVLGRGDVRACLSKAKEMRNRWKYLDEQQAGGDPGLAECNVEVILETIVNAFEAAYEVAKGKVVSECGEPEQHVDWGFMVDAMDWEAL